MAIAARSCAAAPSYRPCASSARAYPGVPVPSLDDVGPSPRDSRPALADRDRSPGFGVLLLACHEQDAHSKDPRLQVIGVKLQAASTLVTAEIMLSATRPVFPASPFACSAARAEYAVAAMARYEPRRASCRRP